MKPIICTEHMRYHGPGGTCPECQPKIRRGGIVKEAEPYEVEAMRELLRHHGREVPDNDYEIVKAWCEFRPDLKPEEER